MEKPNEVTEGLTNVILNTQRGEGDGETLSMEKPNEVTERLDYNKDERFHEEWNKKEEGNRRREKRIALFEIGTLKGRI